MRMVQTLIGRDKFRAGMDLYFAAPRRRGGDHRAIHPVLCRRQRTRSDAVHGVWYSQAGTPEVTVHGNFDSARRTYTLECSQIVPPTPGQAIKEPMVIPLALGLVGMDGRDLPLKLSTGKAIAGGHSWS